MIHYTCDGCKRIMVPEEQVRYVVKMEIYAAVEPVEQDAIDDDRDHLLEIQDILERMDSADDDEIGDEVYQQLRFDLCPACRKKLLENPLPRGAAKHFDFSEN